MGQHSPAVGRDGLAVVQGRDGAASTVNGHLWGHVVLDEGTDGIWLGHQLAGGDA